jgi:predicted GNAT family acetyltransferase
MALGDGRAKRFIPEISVFAAVPHPEQSLDGLAAVIPQGALCGLVTAAPISPPPEFELVRTADVVQMTAEDFAPASPTGLDFVTLGPANVPAMVALVELTRPGPFGPRTLEMGHYLGIFEGERLIAMTGERLHLNGWGEVSAVCTHPDYRGRGLAKALVSAIGSEVVARGEIPFLQAYPDNAAAIATYERLGFTYRATLVFTQLRRR